MPEVDYDKLAEFVMNYPEGCKDQKEKFLSGVREEFQVSGPGYIVTLRIEKLPQEWLTNPEKNIEAVLENSEGQIKGYANAKSVGDGFIGSTYPNGWRGAMGDIKVLDFKVEGE